MRKDKSKINLEKAAAADAAAAEFRKRALQEKLAQAEGFLDNARGQAGDFFENAREQAAPAFRDAKVKTADFAARKLDEVEPHIRGALDKIQPGVDAARLKVADNYLPKLSEQLHKAAEHTEHTAAQLKPAEKKSGNVLKTVFKVLLIGGIVAGAVAALRHFLSPKDDGWTAHEPSRAYVNNNDTFATAAKVAEDSHKPAPTTEEEAEAEMVAEGGPVDESENRYGAGSFVGTNPPEGFTIKGNERSMKYHVPGTGGYDRTIAEVWFTSEEAAEAAGFSKAQR